MDVERRIASAPVRSVTETSNRLLELAGAWGGREKIGDLSQASPVLRALILDRILQKSPLAVEYGAHTLWISCDYEDEALDIEAENEELPSRLPHPVGDDVVWRMIVPCPDGLRSWAVAQARPIKAWFIIVGPDGEVQRTKRPSVDVRSEKAAVVEIDEAALQRLIDQMDKR